MLEVLLMQAIEHVRHLDQKHIVKIYDYTILNNFNIKQFENNLIKMIFSLITELNDELFNITFNIDTKKIDFDYWMCNHNDTLSLVSHNSIDHFDFKKLVQSDELIYTLLETMKKKSQFRMHFLCDNDYFSENSDSVSDDFLDVSNVEWWIHYCISR